MSLFPVDRGFPLHFLEKIILKNGFQTSALDTWEYLRFWQACIIEFWKSLFESRRIFFIFWKSFQSYYCRNNVIDNVPLARLLLSPFCSIYSKPFFIFVICFIFHIPSPPPLFFVHHRTLPNCDLRKSHKIVFHIYRVGNSPKGIFFPLYLEVFFTIINDVLLITRGGHYVTEFFTNLQEAYFKGVHWHPHFTFLVRHPCRFRHFCRRSL